MKHPSISETKRKITLLVLAATLLLVSMTASSQTYKVLYNFGTNTDDPRSPSWSGVFAQGRDGNLYSTSQAGGTEGHGTIFQLTPEGTVKVLYSFPVGTTNNGLTLGTDGYLYGTTSSGGAFNTGSAFKIATNGTAYTTLYSFKPGVSGYTPITAPIQGVDGNFYGTTAYGHTTGLAGSVYKMTPKGVLRTLHEFDRGHGFYPTALMQATDGNFYGTTLGGDTGPCNGQCGVIFKMTAAGKFTVLHNFTNADGNHPYGPMIQASDGNFYGTTRIGGSSGYGVVYNLTYAQNSALWGIVW
jgi:uncharacterized repeat protein (TIGR03803 family)